MIDSNIITVNQYIYNIRGMKVMLSHDLSSIYGVETKALNQSVKRNIERFPKDFMFQLSKEEFANLKSQFVTSSWGGARRSRPYAFTELGVAMLSSVLKSDEAVQANIAIMRAFVKMREVNYASDKLRAKLKDLELKVGDNSEDIETLFETINRMLKPENRKKNKIGFIKND